MSDSEITTLKVSQARMEEKIDNIIASLEDIKSGKADKWVERAMTWLIVATVGMDFTIATALIIWWIKQH